MSHSSASSGSDDGGRCGCEDLDDNIMAKMMDINISQALKLTWEQCNYHSWRFRLDGGGGYTQVVYSWSPDAVNASSVWNTSCHYILQLTHEITGWSWNGTTPCPEIARGRLCTVPKGTPIEHSRIEFTTINLSQC